jgi:hypothetical protein
MKLFDLIVGTQQDSVVTLDPKHQTDTLIAGVDENGQKRAFYKSNLQRAAGEGLLEDNDDNKITLTEGNHFVNNQGVTIISNNTGNAAAAVKELLK